MRVFTLRGFTWLPAWKYVTMCNISSLWVATFFPVKKYILHAEHMRWRLHWGEWRFSPQFSKWARMYLACGVVAERTLYFCLARKLTWPLGSTHIFTQWEWLILFNLDHFSGQHQIGESPPYYPFLRTFRTGWTYFLSAPFIAAASQHPEESHLIYGPLESTLLD